MVINVKEYDDKYDFLINGLSYIGNPRPNTAMFITCKVAHLIRNLYGISNCLIFAEKGVEIPAELLKNNCFICSAIPQHEYAELAFRFYKTQMLADRQRRYCLTDSGYYIGENVQIGENAYIEPGCLIGHDVVIGKNAMILSGAIIKHAIIGDYFVANESAMIGTNGFTMTEDVDHNKTRIPSLGRVIIGNHVEIGALDNISRGSSGDTVIEDYAKVDALVHIAHDVHLQKNAEVTAGGIIGGYTVVGEGVFTGINASIRNRVNIGNNALVGMGAVVTKNVESKTTEIGNPAHNKAD